MLLRKVREYVANVVGNPTTLPQVKYSGLHFTEVSALRQPFPALRQCLCEGMKVGEELHGKTGVSC